MNYDNIIELIKEYKSIINSIDDTFKNSHFNNKQEVIDYYIIKLIEEHRSIINSNDDTFKNSNFNNKQEAIVYYIVELIEEYRSIINSIDDTFKSSQFNNKQEAIDYLQTIINKLQICDEKTIDQLVYFFMNGGIAEEMAVNGDKTEQYEYIKLAFDLMLMDIRSEQKKDGQLFNQQHDGKYTDSHTYSDSPGRINISDTKWSEIISIYNLHGLKKFKMNRKRKKVQEYLLFGDTNPAIVAKTSPLLIAVYSYDLDAVIMLSFPQEYQKKYQLKKYDRLISVNTYYKVRAHYDIFYGENYMAWADFQPNIADFLSDETEKIETHKQNTPQKVWSHVEKLSDEYLLKNRFMHRDGFWFIKARGK